MKFAIKILLNIQVVSQYGFNKVIYQSIYLVIFLSLSISFIYLQVNQLQFRITDINEEVDVSGSYNK